MDAPLYPLLLAALAELLALWALSKHHPWVAFVLHFAAAWQLGIISELTHQIPWLWGQALLLLPLSLWPGLVWKKQTLVLLLPGGVGLAGGLLLFHGLAAMGANERRPRPILADYWTIGDPMRTGLGSLLLSHKRFEARILTHQGDYRFYWPLEAGGADRDVILHNAGPVGGYRIYEGDGRLEGLSDSRVRLHLHYEAKGGLIRLVARPMSQQNQRVLLVANGDGDLAALQRLLARFADDPPQLVVLLGDMVRNGNLASLLAIRDLVDHLGQKSIYVPGPGERGPFGLRTFQAIFGEVDALRQAAGISAMVLDSSTGAAPASQNSGLYLLAFVGSTMGLPCIFLHHNIRVPKGSGLPLLPDPRTRRKLVSLEKKWKTRLVVSGGEGAGFDCTLDGVRHLAVGRDPRRLLALMLHVDQGKVQSVQHLSLRRSKEFPGRASTFLLRVAAAAREECGLARQLALGSVEGPGGLLLALVGFLWTRRRSKHGSS